MPRKLWEVIVERVAMAIGIYWFFWWRTALWLAIFLSPLLIRDVLTFREALHFWVVWSGLIGLGISSIWALYYFVLRQILPRG